MTIACIDITSGKPGVIRFFDDAGRVVNAGPTVTANRLATIKGGRIFFEVEGTINRLDKDNSVHPIRGAAWQSVFDASGGTGAITWTASEQDGTLYFLLHRFFPSNVKEPFVILRLVQGSSTLERVWPATTFPHKFPKEVDHNAFSVSAIAVESMTGDLILSLPSKSVLFNGSDERQPVTLRMTRSGFKVLGNGYFGGSLSNGNVVLIQRRRDLYANALFISSENKVIGRMDRVVGAFAAFDQIMVLESAVGSSSTVARIYSDRLTPTSATFQLPISGKLLPGTIGFITEP